MKIEKKIHKLAVMILCVCILIPSTLSVNNERALNIQLDALGNPIIENPVFTPLIFAPTLLSPTDGAVFGDDTPTLSWSKVADGQRYQVQVDDYSDFSSPEFDEFIFPSASPVCSIVCEPLPNNQYYWHVRAQDSIGGWSAWSSVWSFTLITAPDPPSLISPANGALTNDPTPTLDWSTVPDATNHYIEVDNDIDFSSYMDARTTISEYVCPFLADDMYYWRVKACTEGSLYSSWSDVWHFQIDTMPPSPPVLYSPANGVVTNDPTPYLDWSTVETATQYNVQVDNNVDFSSPIEDDISSSSSYTCSTLGETTWHWRVCARDAAGNWGSWSSTWHFEIDTTPPATLTLLSPSNNSIDNDPTPYLEWSSVSGAILYQLQVDNDLNFLSTIVNLETTDTNYITEVLSDDVYHWRVRAKDGAENWGDWSDVWNFQVDTTAPIITNVENDPTTPTDVESVTFSCDVADLNGIDEVILHYRLNSGAWTNVTMALDSGITYQVTLGPFAYNDLFEYSIIAFDTAIHSNAATNDNGGAYYSFTVVSSDVTGPTISAISQTPEPADDTETITISCDVTDANGIQSVTLYYRINSGSWTDASLVFTSGSNYEATIGSFDYDDEIEYYIVAVDDSPNHNEATDDNSGTYYSFIITSSDVTGPTINNVNHTPSTPNASETITISCSVVDTNGIQIVTLFYRVNSGSWVSISMSLDSGDIYLATIGPFTNNTTVEYYISATDDSPNQNVAIVDNEGAYYSFTVYTPPISTPPPTSTPPTTNETSLALLIPFVVALLSTIITKKRKKQ